MGSCIVCGVEVDTWARKHLFEAPRSGRVFQYCDEHCPNCTHPEPTTTEELRERLAEIGLALVPTKEALNG